MSTPRFHDDLLTERDHRVVALRERWAARYGPGVAAALEPDRRYSLVRVGDAEYAFTSYDAYVRALGDVWTSELVPEPLPSAIGSQLLEVAPNLQAVDPQLGDLRVA
jgi:hypothetical protein